MTTELTSLPIGYEADLEQVDALNTTNKPIRVRKGSPEFTAAEGDDTFCLPGGLEHEGKWLRRVKLRPMNGFDEEQLGTAEARRSQHQLTDILLRRLIVSIEDITDERIIHQLVPRLLVGDRSMLLFMVYKISESDIARLPVECQAPRCKHQWKHDFDLDGVEYDVYATEPPPKLLIGELPRGFKDEAGLHKSVEMVLADGEVERALSGAGDNIGVLKTLIMQMCCQKIGDVDPVTEYVFRSLTKKDRTYLNHFQSTYTPGPIFVYMLPCERCGADAPLIVRPESFFAV